MAQIVVELGIDAKADDVWGVISDVDNEPDYWKGTKSVRNISKDGNTIRREITIAFRDQKCMQDVVLSPQDFKVDAVFTGGIIKGRKSVQIVTRGVTSGEKKNDGDSSSGGGNGKGQDSAVLLRTTWDIKMTGMMGMFTGMLSGHIRNGTEIAMQSIKEAAEAQRQ